jgi:diacylglycerol kinase (ATP)
MKIVIIANPTSGRRKARKLLPELLNLVRPETGEIDLLWTEYPGHAGILAASARRRGCDRVIAAGGDGTLFEVVNGLWREGQGGMPSIGMVPFGTGCDYIRNFEVGSSLVEKLRAALGRSTIPVTAGLWRYDSNVEVCDHVFLMVLGLGFDAQVIRRFRSRSTVRYGWAAYALSVLQELRRIKPFKLSGEIDGSFFEAETMLVTVALSRYFGGGIEISPGASPASDKFELMWVRPMSSYRLLCHLLQAYWGGHAKSSHIEVVRGGRVRLNAMPPQWMEAEGEPLGKTPVTIEAIPAAFNFAAGGLSGVHAWK